MNGGSRFLILLLLAGLAVPAAAKQLAVIVDKTNTTG